MTPGFRNPSQMKYNVVKPGLILSVVFGKFIAYRRAPGALCMTEITMKVERRDLL